MEIKQCYFRETSSLLCLKMLKPHTNLPGHLNNFSYKRKNLLNYGHNLIYDLVMVIFIGWYFKLKTDNYLEWNIKLNSSISAELVIRAILLEFIFIQSKHFYLIKTCYFFLSLSLLIPKGKKMKKTGSVYNKRLKKN